MLIMKKLIFFIIATIFTLGLFAQSNTVVTTTIQGDGYTYVKKTKKSRLVNLYNQDNEYTDVPMEYNKTGESAESDEPRGKLVENDNWTGLRAEQIVNTSFTSEQMDNIEGHKLGIGLYVNTTTGKVVGTEYTFIDSTPMAGMPLSLFRKIELRMKDEIYFTLTNTGKKYNYIYFYWIQEIVDISKAK